MQMDYKNPFCTASAKWDAKQERTPGYLMSSYLVQNCYAPPQAPCQGSIHQPVALGVEKEKRVARAN